MKANKLKIGEKLTHPRFGLMTVESIGKDLITLICDKNKWLTAISKDRELPLKTGVVLYPTY
jgi:hypothetical protein|tara:strand:- start:592 stop:777 length:186 start_codon:yes stop_codon:yes gene_type:complete